MIERIYVHNFRCLENFSVDLTSRGSVLIIGKNGSGKSTLRQALGLLQNVCRGSGRVRDLISESDFTQHRRHIPMKFAVDLSLKGKRLNYSISFKMPEGVREAQIVGESLLVDGTPEFLREFGHLLGENTGGFELNGHVAALSVISGDWTQTVRSYLASMVLIAPIPDLMSGYSEEETTELRHDASNFSSWLRQLLSRTPAAYNALDTYLKSLIPDLESFEYVLRGEKGKQLLVKFQALDSKQPLAVEFKQLSDGEKCFFLSALIVASNRFNGPIFCLWDEPDNHLSLPEVGYFTTQLRKITNQGGQLIVTSHHPETIRRFSDDSTLVFTRKSHLEPTVARNLADYPYEGDLIASLVKDEVIG